MAIGICIACCDIADTGVIAAVCGIDGMGVDGIVGTGVIADGIAVIGGIICIVGLIVIDAAHGTAGGGNGGCGNVPSMPLP